MLERFKHYIHSSSLLRKEGKYLLAISGGIDSVALAHLLHLSGFSFSMVHCNFRLRGGESDAEEQFIKALGLRLNVDVIVRHFDTAAYKLLHGVSTQMAARELRYAWFEELVASQGAEGILVAHHAGDQVETVLLNLLRGTGIEGVYGMAAQRDGVIRPLLPFTREDIAAFVADQQLDWKVDSSNKSSDYKRNLLRNEVLPVLRGAFGDVNRQLGSSFNQLKDTGQAFFYLFDAWRNAHVSVEKPFESLAFTSIKDVPGRSSLLYYWLREFGFNFPQVADILRAIDTGSTGKVFEASAYMANVDRDCLIVGPIFGDFEERYISKDEDLIRLDYEVYELMTLDSAETPDKNPDNAMLDKNRLTFPLLVRNWKEGDKFIPLGMRRFKKVSDFLIDLRVPNLYKKQVKVLCSGSDIVWLIGYRIDDRYKVSSTTGQVMYIKKRKHV
nr:tRNA lysidine(34) synthetase TilS [Cytophagales bacterium]